MVAAACSGISGIFVLSFSLKLLPPFSPFCFMFFFLNYFLLFSLPSAAASFSGGGGVPCFPLTAGGGEGVSSRERTASPAEVFRRGMPKAITWSDVTRQFAPISVSVSPPPPPCLALRCFYLHSYLKLYMFLGLCACVFAVPSAVICDGFCRCFGWRIWRGGGMKDLVVSTIVVFRASLNNTTMNHDGRDDPPRNIAYSSRLTGEPFREFY